MIDPKILCNLLSDIGADFFTGVPDSLLKPLCTLLGTYPQDKHIIAANEGCAVGLAAGVHMATGSVPVVYMQNSGMGNATNPLLSLTDQEVYSIPLIMLIGWRGEPGVKDEPQHVKQGKLTCELLGTMGIEHVIMAQENDELKDQMRICEEHLRKNSSPFAFVIRKGTFSDVIDDNDIGNDLPYREEAIEKIVKASDENDIFVSTTGMASRELYEIRERMRQGHEKDFLTVGSMGHASQIAAGIAIKRPDRKVFCIDGDGAVIMHMGGMSAIGKIHPANLVHIVLNNGSHDSVGGQPTAGPDIDMLKIAEATGYVSVHSADTVSGLNTILGKIGAGPVFIEIKIRKGARKDLGRPKETPQENKRKFMEHVSR